MFSLIFHSQAAYPFSEKDLKQLAIKARKKNKKLSITGFLQYKEGFFLHYLEGEKENVLTLMQAIQEDNRHVVLNTIHLDEIESPRFDNWHFRHWKESERSYLKLVDLLDDTMRRIHPVLYDENRLQERIIRLLNLISEHQKFIDELSKSY